MNGDVVDRWIANAVRDWWKNGERRPENRIRAGQALANQLPLELRRRLLSDEVPMLDVWECDDWQLVTAALDDLTASDGNGSASAFPGMRSSWAGQPLGGEPIVLTADTQGIEPPRKIDGDEPAFPTWTGVLEDGQIGRLDREIAKLRKRAKKDRQRINAYRNRIGVLARAAREHTNAITDLSARLDRLEHPTAGVCDCHARGLPE